MDEEEILAGPQENPAAAEAQMLAAGDLTTIAVYLAGLLAAGLLPNAVWDLIKGTSSAVRRRFGEAKLEELEELVTQELQKVQRKGSHLSKEDLRLRAKELLTKIREG